MKEVTVLRALNVVSGLDFEEAHLLGRAARKMGVYPLAQIMAAFERGYQAEKEREVRERSA